MKGLVFGKGLLPGVLSGDKETTIRLYRPEAHDFKEDEVVMGEFKDGFNVMLRMKNDTLVKPLSELSDLEASCSGYLDAEDARKGLKEWYPNLQPDDTVAILTYQVYRVEDVPVVAFNAHMADE